MQWIGAARTQAPTDTNYDAGSTTWADLSQAPLRSAMVVAKLGHGPYGSPIDPIQVSMFHIFLSLIYLCAILMLELLGFRCGIYMFFFNTRC